MPFSPIRSFVPKPVPHSLVFPFKEHLGQITKGEDIKNEVKRVDSFRYRHRERETASKHYIRDAFLILQLITSRLCYYIH